MSLCTSGREKMYGGLGFRGGTGGGQGDEGGEQRGPKTKAFQQKGQRFVSCSMVK